MPLSRSDKPTVRKSRSADTIKTPRSAADLSDERYVWSGKVFRVFSIPNVDAQPWYVRINVSNLPKDDYVLYVENGSLFTTDASLTESPFQVFAPQFKSHETPEEGNQLILSSRSEYGDDPPGDMIQIPPHSQLNVTMRLRKDCYTRQDFSVTVYRHFGKTRDTDFHKGRPLFRDFFQIPEADTCALDVEVLTRTARFRPWNLAARRSHFFWKLAFFGHPLFNRPEFLVEARNRGSLPVNVQAHLYKVTGKEKKAFGIDAPEETLAPGQECVWTFPLWLRDPQEAEEIIFESSLEVKNGGDKLKDIVADDKVNAEYFPYRSLFRDIVALCCIVGLLGGLLLWATWGIPVWVTPQIGIHFQFDGHSDGDLPRDIPINEFTIAELDENGNQIVSSGVKTFPLQPKPAMEMGIRDVYICKLPPRLMGYRWPFGWGMFSSHERSFIISIDPSGKFKSSAVYDYNPDELKIAEPPTLKFHLPLNCDAMRIHNFAIKLKKNNYLTVDTNLTGKAAEAKSVEILLSVQANGSTTALPSKSSFVYKGKANAIDFDITNYVSTGSPIDILITANTSNKYTSSLLVKSFMATAHPPTVTMKNFQSSEQTFAPSGPPGGTQPQAPTTGTTGITPKTYQSPANPTTGTAANRPRSSAHSPTGTATPTSSPSGSTAAGQPATSGQPPTVPSTTNRGDALQASDPPVGPASTPISKGGSLPPLTRTPVIPLEPKSSTPNTPQDVIPVTGGTPIDPALSSFTADELMAFDTPEMTAQAAAKADAMLQRGFSSDQQAAAYAVKGMVHLKNNQVDAAKEDIDQAMTLSGSQPNGHGRAMAYLAQGRLLEETAPDSPQILTDFTKATQTDPKLALAWSDKADYYFAHENRQQAADTYASGMRHDLHSGLFFYRFLFVFHDFENPTKAQAQKQLILKSEPDPNKRRVLGSLMKQLNTLFDGHKAESSVHKRFSTEQRASIYAELSKFDNAADQNARQQVPITAKAGTPLGNKQQNQLLSLNLRLTRQYRNQVRARYHLTAGEVMVINRETVTNATSKSTKN